MFAPTRWRLVASILVVLGLVLGLAGAAVYVTATQRMRVEMDRDLAGHGAALVAAAPSAPDGLLPESHHGYHGSRFFLVTDGRGRVLADPQGANLRELPPAPADGSDAAFRDALAGGEPVRLYVVPTSDTSAEGRRYVVGQGLAQVQDSQRRLLAALVAGGAIGLALAVVASWFLAGLALVPIEGAFRRQQEFVADASHELRAPLTVLRAAADLLDRRRDAPLAVNGALFDDLRRELARLERLAGDLLTLARSDRGELELQVAPLDLAILVTDVVRRATPLGTERGVRLDVEPGDKAVVVEADPDRIEQVLLILLDNALRHTAAGGRILLGVVRRGTEAVLTVRDTGEGIAPERLPRLFDRFYRADPSRAGAGAGLGLAIARTLVAAHGGRVEVASTVGLGTRVTLYLPAVPDVPAVPSPAGAAAPPAAMERAASASAAPSATPARPR